DLVAIAWQDARRADLDDEVRLAVQLLRLGHDARPGLLVGRVEQARPFAGAGLHQDLEPLLAQPRDRRRRGGHPALARFDLPRDPDLQAPGFLLGGSRLVHSSRRALTGSLHTTRPRRAFYSPG